MQNIFKYKSLLGKRSLTLCVPVVVHGAMGRYKNRYKLVCSATNVCPGSLQGHMPRVSHQSRLPAKDKDGNEIVRICLTSNQGCASSHCLK